MVFALAVFSLACAVMVWVSLRAPRNPDPKPLRRQAAQSSEHRHRCPGSENPKRGFFRAPRVAARSVLEAFASREACRLWCSQLSRILNPGE